MTNRLYLMCPHLWRFFEWSRHNLGSLVDTTPARFTQGSKSMHFRYLKQIDIHQVVLSVLPVVEGMMYHARSHALFRNCVVLSTRALRSPFTCLFILVCRAYAPSFSSRRSSPGSTASSPTDFGGSARSLYHRNVTPRLMP